MSPPLSGGGPARSRLCVAAPTRTRSRKTRAHTTPCPCASTCSPTVTVYRTIVGAPQRAWRGVVRARRGHGFFSRRASRVVSELPRASRSPESCPAPRLTQFFMLGAGRMAPFGSRRCPSLPRAPDGSGGGGAAGARQGRGGGLPTLGWQMFLGSRGWWTSPTSGFIAIPSSRNVASDPRSLRRLNALAFELSSCECACLRDRRSSIAWYEATARRRSHYRSVEI